MHQCAQLVVDKRPGDHSRETFMFVALFRKTPQPQCCTILKFDRDNKVKFVRSDVNSKFKWADPPRKKAVTIPEGQKDRLYNCIMVKGDKILLVTEKRVTTLDFNLEQLKQAEFKDHNPYWTGVTCFSADLFDRDDDRFLMS